MRKFGVCFTYQAGDSVSEADVQSVIRAAMKDSLPAGLVLGTPVVAEIPTWERVETSVEDEAMNDINQCETDA